MRAWCDFPARQVADPVQRTVVLSLTSWFDVLEREAEWRDSWTMKESDRSSVGQVNQV